jgi:hypothetical protein
MPRRPDRSFLLWGKRPHRGEISPCLRVLFEPREHRPVKRDGPFDRCRFVTLVDRRQHSGGQRSGDGFKVSHSLISVLGWVAPHRIERAGRGVMPRPAGAA